MTLSLAYEEPSVTQLLILSSFFVLLNAIEWSLDRLIYCGLLGQILLGTAWGTPGAGWLSVAFEQAVVQLGYIGLLLLIFQGGLESSVSRLRRNALVSIAAALTGITIPIGLSFLLMKFANASLLQSFAAGSALSSTSLGTTLTVLRASGLADTRLGAVLSSAALIDDVVGLVLVQLIQNLGGSISTASVLAAVLRPTGVSCGLVLICVLLCRYVVSPLRSSINTRPVNGLSKIQTSLANARSAFFVHMLILLCAITVASYAGSSNLLAAYLAGAGISWWDDSQVEGIVQTDRVANPQSISGQTSSGEQAPTMQTNRPTSNPTPPLSAQPDQVLQADHASSQANDQESHHLAQTPLSNTGKATFERYLGDLLDRFLKPCFFASIGFALPIRAMFKGSIVWRGIVYAILMTIGKLATGVWLIRFRASLSLAEKSRSILTSMSKVFAKANLCSTKTRTRKQEKCSRATNDPAPAAPVTGSPRKHKDLPASLYPGLLLGVAMVPRGEVGFLIAALAQANSLLGDGEDAPIFLIVNWAIFLCTAVGPLAAGLLSRRVRALEAKRAAASDTRSPLGVWGVGDVR